MITILETAASELVKQEHAILNQHDNRYLKYYGRVENISRRIISVNASSSPKDVILVCAEIV